VIEDRRSDAALVAALVTESRVWGRLFLNSERPRDCVAKTDQRPLRNFAMAKICENDM